MIAGAELFLGINVFFYVACHEIKENYVNTIFNSTQIIADNQPESVFGIQLYLALEMVSSSHSIYLVQP